MNPDQVIPVSLRMPVALHALIHQKAKADRRSAHSLILRLLEKAMEKEQSHATA